MTEEISSITICSPYFHKLPKPFENVVGFCEFLRRRSEPHITIITRPPAIDQNAISLEMARALDRDGVEFLVRPNPYLHSKLYHICYQRGHFRSFVGSSNFTLGGLEKNQELMAELEGIGPKTPCDREVARLTGPGALTYQAWINRERPEGAEEVT
ncbi:phospholipase D family protein [Sphingorhabdus sp. Alg231-15]|uniref:phospholipase D family protein n=1 Tax=Sphingorhabdus sp. Alg231-15 TaxID=1922222 RepID=UPI003FD14545